MVQLATITVTIVFNLTFYQFDRLLTTNQTKKSNLDFYQARIVQLSDLLIFILTYGQTLHIIFHIDFLNVRYLLIIIIDYSPFSLYLSALSNTTCVVEEDIYPYYCVIVSFTSKFSFYSVLTMAVVRESLLLVGGSDTTSYTNS